MTRRTFKCCHCKRIRLQNPRIKEQQYCGAQECQNARKNEWRKKKLCSDDAYRQGKRESQKQWQEANPDYWKKYRAGHYNYTKNNRNEQVRRNTFRSSMMIAKRDALSALFYDKTMRYEIFAVEGDAIAKRDALIVEIVALSGG